MQSLIFEDHTAFNSYDRDPFEYQLPQNASGNSTNLAGSKELFFPYVNVTQLQQILDSHWEINGYSEKVKDTLQIENVYPRWLGFGNISYAQSETSETKHMNTIFNLGDSDLEVDMGVAQGFPNTTLSPYDIIIPKSLAEFFGWSEDQPHITMTFNILKMILNSD